MEPLQCFNTSFVLEQGLVLLCQNVCTSPFTTSTNFMSLRKNLPLNSHKVSIFPSTPSLYVLTEYFLSVFGCKHTNCDVHLIKLRCLVDLLTIDLAKTRQARLQSYEQVFLPIDVNASTRDFTMWLLDSILFNFIMPKFLLTFSILLHLIKAKNNSDIY